MVKAVLAVVEQQKIVVRRDGNRMLPDGRQGIRAERQRIPPQRWKLIPLLGRVAEDPFDRAGAVIEGDDEIFPAGNDERIVAGPIACRVVMKPIIRRRMDKLTWVIAASGHRVADDLGEIPSVKNVTGGIDFEYDRFGPGGSVHLNQDSLFPGIVVVMAAPGHTNVAVVLHKGEGAVQLHPGNAGNIRRTGRRRSDIDAVSKEDGGISVEAGSSYPTNGAIGIDDYRRLIIAAVGLQQDVIVAQGRVAGSGLIHRGIAVAAQIGKDTGRDGNHVLFARVVEETGVNRHGIGVIGVQAEYRESNGSGLEIEIPAVLQIIGSVGNRDRAGN